MSKKPVDLEKELEKTKEKLGKLEEQLVYTKMYTNSVHDMMDTLERKEELLKSMIDDKKSKAKKS